MSTRIYGIILIALVLFVLESECRAQEPDEGRARYQPRRDSRKRRGEKPNIILILTDDQDVMLGSMEAMPHTRRILGRGGAEFTNAFVSTPMCCPSRSSMLTGMYVHNHNVYTNNDNCSSPEWQQKYEPYSFATYLSNAGYRTGYFGKYLNEYQGEHIPPGWSEWVGLIRNTRFYNYSLNFNGERIKHGDDYHKDYLTDLIANDSVTFLKQSKQYFPNRAVAMVLSMPAPHGPEDSAPQYQHEFQNVTSHRVGSWNYAPNPDKQWLLQHTGKMQPIHIAFTDLLQQKRLQTLRSVDEAVKKVYNTLSDLGEADNTYIIYTSDHGYHLGQYGLLKGKAMPYDFDVRVPFYLRGPGIPSDIKVPNMVANIDLAPTMLDMAGVPIPEHMDGRSFLSLFDDIQERGSIVNNVLKRKKAWRDTFLIERGKISHKKLIQRDRLEASKNNFITTKEQRLEQECARGEYAPPCAPKQQWVCLRNSADKPRMYKCRGSGGVSGNNVTHNAVSCFCPVIARVEKRRQRQFLRDVVNQPNRLKPKFLKSEVAEDDVARQAAGSGGNGGGNALRAEDIHYTNMPLLNDDPVFDMAGFGVNNQERRRSKRNRHRRNKRSLNETMLANNGHGVACRVLMNSTVVCDEPVYNNFDSWKEQKNSLDMMIQQYRERLERLKEVRQHLKEVRPHFIDYEDYADYADNVHVHIENTTYSSPLPHLEYEIIDSERSGPKSSPSSILSNEQSGQQVTQSDVRTSPPDEAPPSSTPRPDQHLQPDQEVISANDTSSVLNEIDSYNEFGIDEDLYNSLEFDVDEPGLDEDDLRDLAEDLPAEFDRDVSIVGGEVDYSECDCQYADQSQGKVNDRRRRIQDNRYERQQRRQDKKDDRKTQRDERRGNRRKEKKAHLATDDCQSASMKCFEHTDDHWKTPPLWNKGPFCFCPNSNNNTYWCVRTINETHNFLYCEFITGFVSYYDMMTDPHQLRNAVFDLDYGMLHQMHSTLEKLKSCKGSRECTLRTRPEGSTEHRSTTRRSRKQNMDDSDNETFDSEMKWAYRHRRPVS